MAKKRLNQVSIRLEKEKSILSDVEITNEKIAIYILSEYLKNMDKEYLLVVNLKENNSPINFSIVSIGSINQSIASTREIFKTAILSNASKIILVHNHPSGSLNPSKEDTKVTDMIIKAGELMDIHLLDHIIVASGTDKYTNKYFSFRNKGILNFDRIGLCTDYRDLTFSETKVAEKK